MAKSARNKKAFTKAESPCDKWWVCVRENHLFGDLLPMKDALHILKVEGNNNSSKCLKTIQKVFFLRIQIIAEMRHFWHNFQTLYSSWDAVIAFPVKWRPHELLRDIMHNSCIMSFGCVYSWTISLLIVCWPLSKADDDDVLLYSFVWFLFVLQLFKEFYFPHLHQLSKMKDSSA